MGKKKEKIIQLKKENAELKQKIKNLDQSNNSDSVWFQKIIDSLPNPLFIKNESHSYVLVNQAFSDFAQVPKEELLGKSDYDFFPKEQSEIFWQKDTEVLESGITNWNEEEITVNNENSILLTSKGRIYDKTNAPFVLGVITDITERKKQQTLLRETKEKIELQKRNIQILLREVHHRVKNNMQIVSSLLNMQMNKFEREEVRNAFLGCKNRILAMAEVHEALYQEGKFVEFDFQDYLSSLLHNITIAFRSENMINFKIKTSNVVLGIDTVIPLGLLINEIVTNSVKHGPIKDKLLEIYISLSHEGNTVKLLIGDNGVGMKKPNLSEPSSIGIELMEIFCEQLNTQYTVIEKPAGVHYSVVFDL